MKPKAFQINLPHPRTSKEIIFDYYEIPLDESSPSKIATCKKCKEGIKIIQGSNIYSSFTVGLNFHLRKHLAEWEDYLHKLSKIMTPDSKTICEHSVANKRLRFNTNREESARNVREVNVNSEINRKSKNVAGVCYIPRDCEVLKGKVAEGDIPKILRHLHPFTNKNVHIFELLGTKHENAPLRANYKMSKCLVDNNGDITLDLQRLLCHNVCFFDPEIYGECEHDGNIDLFNDVEYQNSYEGFKLEIEKYPDFQVEKSFDSTILKEVRIIEHDKTAVREMRRLLIIILTLMICQKENIMMKIKQIMDLATGEANIRKPDRGIFLWGPKVKDVDAKVEEDVTINYDEKVFYTHVHKNSQDCPAYEDEKNAVYKEVFYDEGKVYYPCNVGGCCQECPCIPCNCQDYKEPNSFRCPDHNPDHPEMFDEQEDLSIHRREYFNPYTLAPIYERPKADKKKCPPKVKFAQMKKKCKRCRKIFNDHRKHHHVLHDACQLCCHMKISSKKSFSLACHFCFKTFKNKYRLAYHMHSHEDRPLFHCEKCKSEYSSKWHLDKHMKLYHSESPEEFVCSECAEYFSSKDNLNRHIRTKHGERKEEFKCSDCDKTFNRHDNMLKHRTFAHNPERNVLQLSGINDKPKDFKCMHCEKVFTQKFSLIRHLESKHNEDKNHEWKCNFCGKSYGRKDVLIRHQKMHH